MALKIAWIVDFFSVNRANWWILKTQWIVDQLKFLTRNLDHRSFFSLGRNVNEFIQIISFFERSSFKLKCETVVGNVLCYSHQACCLLYIWAKLTVAFTSLPFTLTSILGCGCGFGFKQKFGRSTNFVKNKAGIGGFAYPYSPPR